MTRTLFLLECQVYALEAEWSAAAFPRNDWQTPIEVYNSAGFRTRK